MPDTTDDIVALISAHRPRRPQLGYAPEVRQHVGLWLQQRHLAGAGWTDLGTTLGISNTTAKAWALAAAKQANSLVPVLIEEEPTLPAPSPILVSPSGYRVEGLSIDDIAQLLRTLR